MIGGLSCTEHGGYAAIDTTVLQRWDPDYSGPLHLLVLEGRHQAVQSSPTEGTSQERLIALPGPKRDPARDTTQKLICT